MTASYRIELTRDALRTLAKLDKPVRRRIQGAIDKLAGDPRPDERGEATGNMHGPTRASARDEPSGHGLCVAGLTPDSTTDGVLLRVHQHR